MCSCPGPAAARSPAPPAGRWPAAASAGCRSTARQPRLESNGHWPCGSAAPRQQALGLPEHHHDEENEGDHVAPLEVEEEAAYRDELREQEGGNEAADEVAQTRSEERRVGKECRSRWSP